MSYVSIEILGHGWPILDFSSRSGRSHLYTPLFRRTAAVMRDRRHVDDVRDLEARVVERAHGRLAARAGALDADFDGLDAVVGRRARRLVGRDLRCERRRLARPA